MRHDLYRCELFVKETSFHYKLVCTANKVEISKHCGNTRKSIENTQSPVSNITCIFNFALKPLTSKSNWYCLYSICNMKELNNVLKYVQNLGKSLSFQSWRIFKPKNLEGAREIRDQWTQKNHDRPWTSDLTLRESRTYLIGRLCRAKMTNSHK